MFDKELTKIKSSKKALYLIKLFFFCLSISLFLFICFLCYFISLFLFFHIIIIRSVPVKNYISSFWFSETIQFFQVDPLALSHFEVNVLT